MAEAERPEMVKEVVQLPDGRRLVYYSFASTSPRPPPAGEPDGARAPGPRSA